MVTREIAAAKAGSKRLCIATVIVALSACNGSDEGGAQRIIEADLSTAEVFVDAFYSFDPTLLETALSSAEASKPSILFYQGWAEGGNYEIVDRMPCVTRDPDLISCSITVKDDLIGALGIEFNVTDTFLLTFADGRIVAVDTDSDDPPAFWSARDWVMENRQALIEGPCQGYFDGGPTPGDCVRAMVRGYAEFAASSDFPQSP